MFLSALLQFIRPAIPTKPATAALQAPPEVRRIFDKGCYNCHSDERRLAWFDQIVPAYWLVRHDVLTARRHLNFSNIGARPAAMRNASLYEAVNMIKLGAMPLPRFAKLHPEARVTPEELAALEAYLNPWKPESIPMATEPSSTAPRNASVLAAAQRELNGFPFDPTFESWKLINLTDRGDNNTFRFILGNDMAVNAARTGHITPWPDGARFAKVTWQREQHSDGLVYPGKFVQVELMAKNARADRENEGWAWGRWRGMNLKPYGENARFVDECTGCHQPMRANDYVYTLPIATAPVLSQPLGWDVVTLYVDPQASTMSALFGNDAAMPAVRAFSTDAPAYPPGAVLALVTWGQRDDPHWFGARIPDAPRSVEFVQIDAAGKPPIYRRFAGSGLAEDHDAGNAIAQRAGFLLNLAPAVMP